MPLVVLCWADLEAVHGFVAIRQHSAEREMSASACSRSLPGAGTDTGFADWGTLVDQGYKRATDEGGNSTTGSGSMLLGNSFLNIRTGAREKQREK